ncbi:ESX secretion-associated protein EspG [Sciscionella sediminilitoris]|uniref:ESX secretion-associated protein EspG n=1 Tax=Sciscionella sediminilitoris TaxID=1445613 RepID=UPI0004DF6550|nr:ESX secretion-associated protein EspG [Sciscionella sp. SE31]
MLPTGELLCVGADLERAVAHFGVGELPRVLRGTPVWRDTGEDRAATRASLETLDKAGLLEPNGRLDRDVTVTLEALCQPELAYFGWFAVGGEQWNAIAARRGPEAVLAAYAKGGIYIRQINPDGLIKALDAELPLGEPAEFAPIWYPLDKPVPEPAIGDIFVDNNYTRTEDDLDLIHTLVTSRDGGGEVFVQTRDRSGRVRESPTALGVVTGNHGTWLNTLHTNHHGDRYLFCLPATPDAFAEQLDVLHEQAIVTIQNS